MTCPRCQHENRGGREVLRGVRRAAGRGVRHVRRPLSPTAKFCPECAHPPARPPQPPAAQRFDSPESYTPKHLAEKILTSKAALEGERKQVTVLFADLKGSMELLADRDPEEARKLLDPVLERMMEAVHRYEGTVNQVMGDGIMALFGAPRRPRGPRGARLLRGPRHAGRDAPIRRGGPARPRRRGRRSASGSTPARWWSAPSAAISAWTTPPSGQTTHLAARMEQLADAGHDAAHRRHAAPRRGLRRGQAARARARQGPGGRRSRSTSWSGPAPRRSRLHAAAARGLTRFVGRDAELEQLRQALGARPRPATGRWWRSSGSRAWASRASSGRSPTRTASTAGSSSRPARSPTARRRRYLPVIDLLKGYFAIEDRDGPRAVREKVTGKLLTLDRALEGQSAGAPVAARRADRRPPVAGARSARSAAGAPWTR